MTYEEAKQIATSIFYARGPMMTDQNGPYRCLRSIMGILTAHTEGGRFWVDEKGNEETLHWEPDEAEDPAKESEGT